MECVFKVKFLDFGAFPVGNGDFRVTVHSDSFIGNRCSDRICGSVDCIGNYASWPALRVQPACSRRLYEKGQPASYKGTRNVSLQERYPYRKTQGKQFIRQQLRWFGHTYLIVWKTGLLIRSIGPSGQP